MKAAFDGVAEKYGKIDILVNNAGVSESTPFTEYTAETFEKVMDLNIKGVYNCSKAASEHMIAAGSGVILNTSSMVSQYGQPAGIAYPWRGSLGRRESGSMRWRPALLTPI